jgi:hypothetical protein
MTVDTAASNREFVLMRLIDARARGCFGREPSPSF